MIIVICTLALGCERLPTEVYVPASKQTAEVNIAVSATEVEVGEKLILFATRRNIGDWQRAEREDLSKDACWMVSPPPAYEPAVADNLGWKLEPDVSAKFNLDYRSDHTRVLVFSEPGEYRLSARSHVWCGEPVGAKPNFIVVTVTKNR